MDRETFKENAKKSIDDLFAKIDELEAKKDKAKAETQAEYEAKINELKAKKEELLKKYEELNNATDEKWDEIKITFSSAMDSFKEGFSKISSIFK